MFHADDRKRETLNGHAAAMSAVALSYGIALLLASLGSNVCCWPEASRIEADLVTFERHSMLPCLNTKTDDGLLSQRFRGLQSV